MTLACHSDNQNVFWQPWSEHIWTDPGPSAAMRRAVGSARVLRPQEWPCYHSERTYLMLPSLRGGWGRNAVSQSISSTFTRRLINWWESRWEIFVLCRTSQGVWRAVNGDFSRGDICQKQIPGARVFLFDRFLDSKAGFLAFWSEFTIPLKRFFVYFAWSGDLRHLTSDAMWYAIIYSTVMMAIFLQYPKPLWLRFPHRITPLLLHLLEAFEVSLTSSQEKEINLFIFSSRIFKFSICWFDLRVYITKTCVIKKRGEK